MSEIENGSIVRLRKLPFTAVYNNALDDVTLSMSAKGLYSLINRWITCPDIKLNKEFLIGRSKDGKAAFETAWKELKSKGYLKLHKVSKGRGKFSYWYELDPVDPEEARSSEKPLPTRSVKEREPSVKKSTKNEKYSMESLEKLYGYESDIDDGAVGEMFQAILNLIHEILNKNKATLKVGKEEINASVVKATLLKLTKDDIYFVIENYQKTNDIYNADAWLLTALCRANRHRKMKDASDEAQAKRDFKETFGNKTPEEKIAWIQNRKSVGQ